MCPSENRLLFPECCGPRERDPFFYEAWARRAGHHLVAGVDEAGRGPLAGPVVAAAVILPEDTPLPGVRDSKRMTARAREAAFDRIQEAVLTSAIGVVSHGFIDQFNVLRASLEAMRLAIQALDPRPEFLLVDGIYSVNFPLPQKCLKKGDQLSRSISAASVLAKVYRDRIMKAYHKMYSIYGFDHNKGYGTRDHLEALRRYGPCPVHRVTFKRVVEG
ncbi:MAG: ribonuclease HII [Thermodesulfobacteriota bacterium]